MALIDPNATRCCWHCGKTYNYNETEYCPFCNMYVDDEFLYGWDIDDVV